MNAFFDWIYAFLTTIIDGLWTIISGIFGGIFQIFNVVDHAKQVGLYKDGFTAIDWIFFVISILLFLAIVAILVYLIYLGIRKMVRYRQSAVTNQDLLEEVAALHKNVVKLTKEKERILALKIGQTTVSVDDLDNIFSDEDELEEGAEKKDEEDTSLYPVRFMRLDAVDKKYDYYVAPDYRKDYSLEFLCTEFRNFCCSRMGLFYEEKIIKLMFAGLASTKLILLQGISGTGKTSLPYAMGKFFLNDSTIVSVQPSWRDRAELFGYFNEFSKRFNETEVLRRIYESNYNDDVNVLILDEMNIARVEYYFAEMLSIMEMPDTSEWNIEIVPSSWATDPKKLEGGKLHIPQNVWYIGTANNDDTTFAVSDKVYDRALTINIDNKGTPFVAPDTEPMQVSYSYVNSLYEKAIAENPLDQKYLDLIEQLDVFVIKKFRVAFGNRIIKQLKIFAPVYVACGGDVLEAIDHILATKVFRKFESLNLSLIRDEIKGLINYLNTLFGKNKMVDSIAFLERLQRTY